MFIDKAHKHWITGESSVFFKDKLVLAPAGNNQFGFLKSKFVSLFDLVDIVWCRLSKLQIGK